MNALGSTGGLEVSLSSILLSDAWHRQVLEALRNEAPYAWITGGFVRNAIWDAVYEKRGSSATADVDVIFLGPRGPTARAEGRIRTALNRNAPDVPWSVKDQGRMHLRSGDLPYRTLEEALRSFPDRSSAIAVRLLSNDTLEVLAPFGLNDVFRGIVRPTPAGVSDDRYRTFLDRKLTGWRKRWPHLIIATPAPRPSRSRKAA